MEPIRIYRCLCDRKRLRILNLLWEHELCVCHLQQILEETQVGVSKQLATMKRLGLLEAERRANWMVYRLRRPVNPLLESNLKCLHDCRGEFPELKRDLVKLHQLLRSLQQRDSNCCPIKVRLGRKAMSP